MKSYDADVLILGGGVGGLSAAVYTALNGKKVLVLEKSQEVGGKAAQIKQDGFTFDPGPSIIIMPWVYENIFCAAGRKMEDYLRFCPLDPMYCLKGEDKSEVTFPFGEKEVLNVVREQFPDDYSAFKTFMNKCEFVYQSVKKTLFQSPITSSFDLLTPQFFRLLGFPELMIPFKQTVDRWFSSDLLRALFYSFPTYSGQTYNSRSPSSFLIPYIMFHEGIWYPEGGVGSIPRALFQLCKELGVEFVLDEEVETLEYQNMNISRVKTKKGIFYLARQFISNIDVYTTQQMIGRVTQGEPSYSYVSLQMGIRKKLPGLTHHLSCIPYGYMDSYRALFEKNIFPRHHVLYINTPSIIDPGVAPPHSENIFVVIPTPAVSSDGLSWDEFSQETTEYVLSELNRYGFSLSQKDIITSRIQTPRYFQEVHGNYKGSLFGPNEQSRYLFGLFPLRNVDEQFSNLLYAGGSVQPGAGLPMSVLSGLFVSELLSKR